jgi:NO-binding membrane sensor protein with MHYT domain
MFHVVDCITQDHDLRLVALAGLLCFFACITAMSLVARSRADRGRVRALWVAGAGFVTGCGIWATHFVAMLVRAPAREVWDARYIAVSLTIGILAMAFGMRLVMRDKELPAYTLGAVIFTLAICAMHFTGMAAVTFHYDPLIPAKAGLLAPDVLAVAVAAITALILGAGMVMAVVDHHLAARAHLLSLISDIPDPSRLEAGKADLHEEPVQIAALVQDCLRMVEHHAQLGGLTLCGDVAGGVPRVLVDGRRLKQVLLNLLSNAIKLTPSGGTVTVGVRMTGDGVALSVEDCGIGIAPEDIARSFENFSQIDSSVARPRQGAGLPLSRQPMELHGGTLTLESVVSLGTVATASLPASRVLALSQAAA